MNICIFEDFFVSNLAPVNNLRHTSEIICGALTIKDKIEFYFKPASVTLYSRNYLAAYLREKFPACPINKLQRKECLFLNARVVFDKQLAGKISSRRKSAIWIKDKTIIAIYAEGKILEQVNHIFSETAVTLDDFNRLDVDKIEMKDNVKFIAYPSDIMLFAEKEIKNDIKFILKPKKNLHVSPKSKISKQAAFDTSRGNVYIGSNTTIEPFCFIQGPVYIGSSCTIKSGTTMYGPARIGDYCKVSGEITNSILHSYVNKQHLGFLGHSYLCEWVNLGAGTTTSNLKNNYSEIILNIGGKLVQTGSIFLGSIIGDHTKTGILTMLNTGTLIGILCNIYGSGFPEKIIGSFSWLNAATGENITYEPDKAIATAQISMKRRNVKMSKAYEEMLKYVFENRDNLF